MIPSGVEVRVEAAAKEKFVDMVVDRIVSRVFTEAESRVNHYVQKVADSMLARINKELPL